MPSIPNPRGIGLATAILLFQAGTASGVELPEAVLAWFATDRSIVCVDPDGNDRRCTLDADTHVELRRSPDASTALAFVTYLPDPTGNASVTTAAIFGAGETGWRHVRTLSEIRGALAGKVTFGDRTATFAVAVPRRGDSHCCPTGRKTYRVAIPHEKPEAAGGQPEGSAARQTALDPAWVLTEQMRREKRGDMTGLLSKSFRAAFDAVPRDEDNLGLTILGGGNDVPDRVVRVSGLRHDDVANPKRASVTATLHYTNEDAPKPSFDRSIVVAFVEEDGRWTIDDVHPIDPKGRLTGREVGLKRAFGILTEERARNSVERHAPAPRDGRNEMPDNRRSVP